MASSLGRRAYLRALDVYVRNELRSRGVSIGAGSRFTGRPIVSRERGSEITIGDRASFVSVSTHTALGVNHPVVLRTLTSGAAIRIGDDVGISGGSICAAFAVSIGNGTMLGANVVIVDTNFHPIVHPNRRRAPLPEPGSGDAVSIGSNVFVGTGAIILKGSVIGDDSVVGAGAIVRGTVPSGAVYVS